MLKIEKFSQIFKYNYKKDSVQLYMLNKKKINNNLFFFEKILTQTQVRKLTTLDIFKIKKNMQKQCLCSFFTCFQSMFDELQIYASHVNDDHI